MPLPILIRKPVASVVSINIATSNGSGPDREPPSPSAAKKSSSFNQHGRRSAIGLFVVGNRSIRRVAKCFGVSEAEIEDEIRREMVSGGTLARWNAGRKAA